ncbi:hypothetical protein AKO1_014129 [Acrasis kona]|uniref:Calcineurin-like phosphoesterase domain-containing protein n=1 Tax=Acrasis kona TaxID=1008807 RepID=A0AAW2Z0Q0_9EUKA
MCKIVFSSDLHGNLDQYSSIVQLATKEQASIIVFGGDLFLKGSISASTKTIEAQRVYFTDKILPIVKDYSGHVFFTFGNADFYIIVDVLRKYIVQENFTNIHVVNDEVVQIPNSKIKLLAYAGVPFTRHMLKDWERFDTCDPQEHSLRDLSYIVTKGAVSYNYEQFNYLTNGLNLKEYLVEDDQQKVLLKYGPNINYVNLPTLENVQLMKNFSIECQMRRILNDCKQEDYTNMIWIIHGPPYGTNLDVLKTKTHCGSRAVRQLIHEFQPLASFHGHIHETVDMSGSYKDKIGNTHCYSSGNYPNMKLVSAIVINTREADKAKRVTV